MMNVKQQAFLKLYLGRAAHYHGNATKCYVKTYDCTNERVAQTSGSRLLKQPDIAGAVKRYREKAADDLGIDARFVLEQSVRVYDRAMGDEPIEVDHINSKGAVITSEVREHHPAIAVKALELIGKHTSIQAFQDNVEVTHTHRLELALAKKQKQVEDKASANTIIEGECVEIRNESSPAPGGQKEEKKRVHDQGGQNSTSIAPGKTSSRPDAATAD